MFQPLRKIVLASSSPRRLELLGRFINDFSVEPADVDETLEEVLSPIDAALSLAVKKAEKQALKRLDGACIIGADTVVALNGKIYGKPETPEKAREYLMELCGKTHIVITGVCIIDNITGKKDTLAEVSQVKFADYDNKLMESYISCGEGLDRAGGYAIQGTGSILVEKVDGDYDNVVGLPIRNVILTLLDKKIIKLV